MTAPNRAKIRNGIKNGDGVLINELQNGDSFIGACGVRFTVTDNSGMFCIAKTVRGRAEMFNPLTRVLKVKP